MFVLMIGMSILEDEMKVILTLILLCLILLSGISFVLISNDSLESNSSTEITDTQQQVIDSYASTTEVNKSASVGITDREDALTFTLYAKFGLETIDIISLSPDGNTETVQTLDSENREYNVSKQVFNNGNVIIVLGQTESSSFFITGTTEDTTKLTQES